MSETEHFSSSPETHNTSVCRYHPSCGCHYPAGNQLLAIGFSGSQLRKISSTASAVSRRVPASMLRGVTSRAGISMRAKILASVLVFTAVVAAPGLAADMPRKAPAPMLFSWAGWYVGVNGGYGWADPSALITPADVPLQT